jgi:(1->4)-alpha-D-glucan 1-alpha-D-glucosylmutase
MPRSTPISATYRLQFNKDFTFQAATNLLDYLFDLGVTHVYASPIFRSRPASTHGYDVIDPTRLNPEIGSEADFSLFQEGLRKRGMGLILDVVPNHMSDRSPRIRRILTLTGIRLRATWTARSCFPCWANPSAKF